MSSQKFGIHSFAIGGSIENYNSQSQSWNRIVCEINLPFRLPILDLRLHFKLEGENVIVITETVNTGRAKPSPGLIFNLDRFGQITRTNVTILFDKKKESKKLMQTTFVMYYFKESIKVINKILEGISLNSDIYSIRKIILKDIVYAKYTCEDKFLDFFNPFGSEMNMGLEEYDMQKTTEKLVLFLKNKATLLFEEELVINAKDFLLLHNFRMSSVEIQSAVEYQMAQFLKFKLKQIGRPDQEIAELLKKRLDDWKIEFNLIDPGITSSRQWSDWKLKCYTLRNDVIHNGKIPSESETKQSLNSGIGIINLLKGKL